MLDALARAANGFEDGGGCIRILSGRFIEIWLWLAHRLADLAKRAPQPIVFVSELLNSRLELDDPVNEAILSPVCRSVRSLFRGHGRLRLGPSPLRLLASSSGDLLGAL